MNPIDLPAYLHQSNKQLWIPLLLEKGRPRAVQPEKLDPRRQKHPLRVYQIEHFNDVLFETEFPYFSEITEKMVYLGNNILKVPEILLEGLV